MTSGTTQITAASDSENGARRPATEREFGLKVLRREEAKALISLASDALSQTHSLAHLMHTGIYDKSVGIPGVVLQDLPAETLACMETAEHYLLMLGSVFDERPRTDRPETGP
jgi:hypothetical protein